MTTRKQTEEEALKIQKELLQSILNTIPQGVFWKDVDGRYLGCNYNFAHTLGLESAEHIVGKTDAELSFNLPAHFHSIGQQVIDRNVSFDHIIDTIINLRGEQHWLDTHWTPLHDVAGKVIGILGTCQDVTEQKQAELTLQQSKQALERANVQLSHFKMTLDMTLDGVLMFDAESLRIFYANQGAVNYLGYTQTELLQMSLLELDSEVIISGIYELVLSHVTQPAQRYETVHLRKDGQLIPVEIFLQYVELSERERRFVAIVRDITERKETEMMLQQAKESAEIASFAKSAFLANMSHELRTPLNGILGYAQLLIHDTNLTEKQKNGIRIIQRSGEHLLTLINDILDLSKIEAGKLELNGGPFNLHQFLQDITDLFKMRATQKNIGLIYEALSDMPKEVYGDEKRLRQILLNLLSNAVKFTQRGCVSFKVIYYNNRVRFEVEDTGEGILPNEREIIFVPFQQAGNLEKQVEGTGLGLSISKKLVELMDGKLHVESIPDKGSLFWFEIALPSIQQDVENSKFSTTITRTILGYKGPSRKILVVDDVFENRMLLSVLLEDLGFTLLQAENGAEALEMALEHSPEVIITDLLMPVMDGIELTKQVRQSVIKDVIIIMNSASVFEQDQRGSLAAGCNAFVAKPINTKFLLSILQRYLKLEWIYEAHEEKTESLDWVLPSPEQAETLLRLVVMGDVVRITENVTQLEQQNPALSCFAKKVKQLAQGFKIAKIEELIKSHFQPEQFKNIGYSDY
ncbi:MAG: hypothetical protein BWK79_08975 [Beggiatoa sp. IS2]|nr:MAG: hypothetical protein BWK79_08975 [Beggiatoa sp. IS2]